MKIKILGKIYLLWLLQMLGSKEVEFSFQFLRMEQSLLSYLKKENGKTLV